MKVQFARRKTETPISVDHAGQRIVYRDDAWHCDALGFSDAKLSAIKSAIERKSRSERRLDVPALHLNRAYCSGAQATVRRVTVTTIAEDGRDVWIVGEGRDSREKVAIDNVAPLEQAGAADKWLEADRHAKTAVNAAELALKAIKRHTPATLRALADAQGKGGKA